MPREGVVKWRLQEGKEGYVPSQRDRRENTGVLEDIRFMSDQIMYDTLSEGKRNNDRLLIVRINSTIKTLFTHYILRTVIVFRICLRADSRLSTQFLSDVAAGRKRVPTDHRPSTRPIRARSSRRKTAFPPHFF